MILQLIVQPLDMIWWFVWSMIMSLLYSFARQAADAPFLGEWNWFPARRSSLSMYDSYLDTFFSNWVRSLEASQSRFFCKTWMRISALLGSRKRFTFHSSFTLISSTSLLGPSLRFRPSSSVINSINAIACVLIRTSVTFDQIWMQILTLTTITSIATIEPPSGVRLCIVEMQGPLTKPSLASQGRRWEELPLRISFTEL